MKTLLCMAVVFASCSLSSGQNQFLRPEGVAHANGYSHVVISQPGNLIFISGQIATDANGKLVGPGDLRAQSVQVFENLKKALASAGATFNDVVKITWYIKAYKPESLPVLRGVRDMYVNKSSPPASTLVGVASLFQEDYLLEVEAIAVVPVKAGSGK